MSRTTAIEDVYRWTDGGHVAVHSGWSQDLSEETTRFIVKLEDHGDWAASLLYSPKNRQLIRFGDGDALLHVPPEALRRVRGFLVDLGARRPRFGPSLVRNLERSDPYSAITYPRAVPDVVWEDRYASADPYLFRRTSGAGTSGTWENRVPRGAPPWLGWIEDLEITGPELRNDGLFNAMWDHGSVDAAYFPKVVDRVIELELLLAESSMRAWDAENVVRGEWVLPGPDEVELYRLLGEDLPVLWPYEKLLPWLVERGE